MPSRYAVRTNLPIMGRAAFARAEAMGSLGSCGAALHRTLPICRKQIDRNESALHPGEGCA